jgi:tetratricopeptide (TPR) repeat protein
MTKHTAWIARVSILLVIFSVALRTRVAAQAAPEPLRASKLLALVAGNALPENIVNQIKTNGLAFRPDDAYRSLLKTAGADAIVLAALDRAKVSSQDSATAASGKDILQHIANAGASLKDKRYDEAAGELTSALTNGFKCAECGFVMGEALLEQQNWPESQAVYEQVLQQDPNFPEAHTKLSFIFYRENDAESAYREAKTALARTPQNAEAHKDAGLALGIMHKPDAAEAELNEALRIKPVYPVIHFDLGILFASEGAWDKAIVEYKKAIEAGSSANVPYDLADAAYRLAGVFDQKNDIESAIREYREAKRLDPKWYDPRQNLGHDLLELNRFGEAVQEFRELEAIYPNSSMCHESLGAALSDGGDFAGAEKEFTIAEQLDTSDPFSHNGMGQVRERQKRYSEALKEFQRAVQLNPQFADAWEGAGRVLLALKDYADAAEQLKQAETMRPDEAGLHDLYGQALAGAGQNDAAIGEFKAALELQPKQTDVMMRLAAVYEKKGDWASSLNEYHETALVDSSTDYRGRIIPKDAPNPQREYEAAQKRWDDHIAALKASGKAAEAAKLDAQFHQAQAAPGLSQQLDALMQADHKADMSRNFSAALDDFRKAVEIADKMQPHDQRLVTALDLLGQNLVGQDNDAAQATFEREVKVASEIFGPESTATANALQSLGRVAAFKGDDDAAERYLFQAVDINTKVFSENSEQVAQGLLIASSLYVDRKQYAKAEPYMQRAVHIEELLYGADDIRMSGPLTNLCALYDEWGKPDQSDACNKKLLTVLEKQYGENSPFIVKVLETDAKALRGMGRATDADAVDKRVATIRAITMNPN